MKSEKFENGLKKLMEVCGDSGKEVIESLEKISPGLAQYTVEYPYGDVYSRSQLDLRSKEIATIAALTALGFAVPQLKVHIHGGLNVGLTEAEIKEIIILMSVYAGFPAALNAMYAAQEVFDKRKTSNT